MCVHTYTHNVHTCIWLGLYIMWQSPHLHSCVWNWVFALQLGLGGNKLNFLIANGNLCYYILGDFKKHLSSHKDKYISQRNIWCFFKQAPGQVCAMNEICTIDRACFRAASHLINCAWNVCVELTISEILALQTFFVFFFSFFFFKAALWGWQQRAINKLHFISRVPGRNCSRRQEKNFHFGATMGIRRQFSQAWNSTFIWLLQYSQYQIWNTKPLARSGLRCCHAIHTAVICSVTKGMEFGLSCLSFSTLSLYNRNTCSPAGLLNNVLFSLWLSFLKEPMAS